MFHLGLFTSLTPYLVIAIAYVLYISACFFSKQEETGSDEISLEHQNAFNDPCTVNANSFFVYQSPKNFQTNFPDVREKANGLKGFASRLHTSIIIHRSVFHPDGIRKPDFHITISLFSRPPPA
mgnify:CR=1 FL=1